MRFGGSGTSFSPTCAELGDALEGLFDTMITTVGNVNRVSYLSGQVPTPNPSYPDVQLHGTKHPLTLLFMSLR